MAGGIAARAISPENREIGKGAAWFEEEYMVDLKDEIIRSLEAYIAGGRP